MKRHRRMTARQRRQFQDICQSALILVCAILFLLICAFGKQILMLTGGFTCVLALMYVMRRF